MADEAALKCGRRGCGKSFTEAENVDGACQFHSGGPIFHEGQKGYACCAKRVLTFEEFLAIPGCCTGKHTTETEALPKFSDTSQVGKDDGKEEYTSADALPPAPAKVSTKQATAAPAQPKEDELNDPEGAVVAPKTPCRRPACKHAFGEGDEGECVFHRGEPVFHEGSKGWSCCSRKVLEFEEFLKIKGCCTGRHRYLATPEEAAKAAAAEADKKRLDVRIDWYQTQTQVIVSLFAKKVDRAASSIEFADEELRVKLVTTDGAVFDKVMPLSQPIMPEQSKVNYLSVKVELLLAKGNGISWVSLEPPVGEIKSFTTFGTTGRVGTVGGKEMYVARDAAILAPTAPTS